MYQGGIQEASRKPRRGVERPGDASSGLERHKRGLKEASKRPQGDLKEAPICLKEASSRPQGSLDEASSGIERHREASKRPQRCLKEASSRPHDASMMPQGGPMMPK